MGFELQPWEQTASLTLVTRGSLELSALLGAARSQAALPDSTVVLCPPMPGGWQACVQDAGYVQQANWSLTLNHTEQLPWHSNTLQLRSPLQPGRWSVAALSPQQRGALSVSVQLTLQHEVMCASDAQCHGHGLCSPSQGNCQCFQGWTGDLCSEKLDIESSQHSNGVSTPANLLILYVIAGVVVLVTTCFCSSKRAYMDKSKGSHGMASRFTRRTSLGRGSSRNLEQPAQQQSAQQALR